MTQFRLPDGRLKRFQFSLFPFSYQLHPAISQIADNPRQLKSMSQRFDTVAKSNALHSARIVSM